MCVERGFPNFESSRRQEISLSAKRELCSSLFSQQNCSFFCSPLWFRKPLDFVSEMETDGQKRSSSNFRKVLHTNAHIALPHIYLFKRYANCAQKWLTLFSHAEHIRERFSNVVLASFDSRLSSLVLRARLEKGKILGGWRKRKHFMPPHPHGTSARFLPRCERFLERKERKCRRDVFVASRFKS